MKKTILTLFISLITSVGTIFASVKIGDLYYNLSSNRTAEVTSQKSNSPYWSVTIEKAEIPETVKDDGFTYTVTSIGENAFSGCSSLNSVSIPNTVTSIGKSAFSGCRSLTSIEIPHSVTSIGDYAFSSCSDLEMVSIGSAVETIGEYAFASCQRIIDIFCYAQRVPTVTQKTFDGVSCRAYLWVPANRRRNYWTHEIWGQFIVQANGAEPIEASNVVIEPNYKTARVIWPTIDNADSYDISITDSNNNTICALTFDSNGLLKSIALRAPRRMVTAEKTLTTGFSFEVTGLDEGTTYDYAIAAKDASDLTIQTFYGSFKTLGGETVLIDITTDNDTSKKLLCNGQLHILRDGVMYNAQGARVE